MVDEPDRTSRAHRNEGFLSRWSRRKHSARGDADTQDPESGTEPAADPVPEPPGDEDMPPVESLGEHSDYSGFMSPRVSEELRTLALRKLFHGAAFHVRDGLDDYDDDFTGLAKLGDVVTAEMRRRLEHSRDGDAGGGGQGAGSAAADGTAPVTAPDASPEPGCETQQQARNHTGELDDDEDRGNEPAGA